ncbi:hypothetical protein BDW60DRAFT_181377 [Aspergillus nidulans var. acristatus]
MLFTRCITIADLPGSPSHGRVFTKNCRYSKMVDTHHRVQANELGSISLHRNASCAV